MISPQRRRHLVRMRRLLAAGRIVLPRDPTYGRVDRDIQAAVDAMTPVSVGQRVAMENTLQARRDRP